ncbi:MAG TPA: cupredoxin domain-containing protein [Candidatus Limnocylindria bacterium]|nr:cupredoxin domain-containing protein [Candidatus Limnocylindria bacterium]HET9877850.1 cupredoxin domain-containing protein [Candidatus Limnocylindria bacterium]
MHRSRPLAILILVLLLAACSSGGASSAPAADGGGAATDDGGSGGGETVSLAGFAFSPSDLTIPAGTTVTFTDTANHTVTEGTDGEAAEDPIVDEDGGSDIEVTFDEPGTYNITCKIHPDMNMTITVEG